MPPLEASERRWPGAHRAWIRTASGLLACLAVAAVARSDVFVFKDGRSVEGSVVKEDTDTLTVRTGVGELVIARKDLDRIVKQKTLAQELEEREKAARTAEDMFQVAQWAVEKKQRVAAERLWKRAIEMDPDHAGARAALGFVLYKGEWLPQAERDRRALADEAIEMRARGLVQHGAVWVTPEEKAHLDAGDVLVGGRWISEADAKRAAGLEQHNGAWMLAAEAQARRAIATARMFAGVELAVAITPDAAVAGTFEAPTLTEIGSLLSNGRVWFDRRWSSEAGLKLLGDRLAEFYCFGSDSQPFLATIPHFASLTRTLPPGWADAVRGTHGFFWCDPYALSSVRLWNRNASDLGGHCLHHWGHLLANRLGYDGRLLPAWYDEAAAAWMEFEVRGQNAVFCQGGLTPPMSGTVAERAQVTLDPALFRRGHWRAYLKAALAEKRVPNFDQLAQLEFERLQLVDIAAGMAILEWLSAREPSALRAFHDSLRRSAPKPPFRAIADRRERQAAYDRAFQAAAGMGWRAADDAWRTWFPSR